jgi:hypothetical protein
LLDYVVSYVLLVMAMAAFVLALALWWRSRRHRQEEAERAERAEQAEQDAPLSVDNLRRLRARLRTVVNHLPRRRALTYCDFPAIEATATIEAWLLQQKPENARAAATIALRADPRDWRVRLHLARTLFYCEEMEAAARELVRARLLGDNSPAQDYLEARIRLAAAEMACARDAAGPEDLATRLRVESAEALEMLLDVVERDPAFGDAAYHAGRLALRIGLEQEGRDLLGRVGPLMDASPEREDYLHEISRLN